MSGHRTLRSADGTAIAYDCAGDGPAMILVGGAFSFRRYKSWCSCSSCSRRGSA